MDAKLIIDDFYVTRTVGYGCWQKGHKLTKEINSYIDVLKSIQKEAISGGDVSEALKSYIDCVSSIKDELNDLGNLLERTTECFITDIDSADKYLF